MQLRFNRYLLVLILLLVSGIDWAVIALVLRGGGDITVAMGAMMALVVVATILLYLMLKPPVLAGIEGDMLRIGRKREHLGDVLRISMAHDLSFAVRARDADGFWAGSMGERTLALKLWRVEGGRKAAKRFVAQVEAARTELPPPTVEAPPAPRLRPRRDGIDPEVAPPIASLGARPPLPARAGFGRKGL